MKSKHVSPNGEKSWSGRGRAPLWVVEICQREGIDLHAFLSWISVSPLKVQLGGII